MSDCGSTRLGNAHHVVPQQLGGADQPAQRPRARRVKALRVVGAELERQWDKLGAWWDTPALDNVPADWIPADDVPATRAECPPDSSVSPCSHVRCTHHLWFLSGDDRPGRRTSSPRGGAGQYLPGEVPRPPLGSMLIIPTERSPACTLTVVEENPAGMRYDDIGNRLGLSGERCRQIARRAEAKLEGGVVALGAAP